MGEATNLLINYPLSKRNVFERADSKTDADRAIARQFGQEFFDGDRKNGYGGFTYNPRFWKPVIPTFRKHWNLSPGMSVLDVGCAKGFMLHDLKEDIPGLEIAGIDVSEYAISHCLESVKPYAKVGDAKNIPFSDNSFDVVISINSIHNLPLEECKQSLREIERVSKGKSFITVDAYNNEDEKERMFAWNLTAKTILSVDDWIKLFAEVGYTGDYFWFMP